jgi:UPF0755 protein
MRKFVWLALAAAVTASLFAGWLVLRFLQSPVTVPQEGLTYEIRPGSSFATISRELGELGVISQPDAFRWYARLTGRASRVHAGEYRIEAGLTPEALLKSFVSGNVILHAFTIVEGWTFRNLVDSLTAHPAIEATVDADDWPTLRETLQAEAEHPEGLFLPETYRFPRHTRDVEILRQSYGMMQSTLAEAWQHRADGLPLATPYEALILASIIEKETALPDERGRIAGVFVRRLQKGMRLQTDPTVIYGAGRDFDGNITRRDLRTDTPYNTYTRRGLPPTPIALPGRAAIEAALNPAPGTALYFVATGLGDGSHEFSETKEEHDAAVLRYLARLREARATGGNR